MNPINAFEWSASPILLNLGILQIRWYGLLFALGFVVGYQIMYWAFIREKKDLKHLETLTMTMILSTVLGARFGHCLFYDPVHYLSHPLDMLKVWEGGLASHGAAVGILFGLYLFHRKTKMGYLWVLDRMVIIVALSGYFIRIGNFFNSEIIGKPTKVAWAVVFTRIDMLPRHPAQLYEALSCFIIFLILFYYYKKNMTPKPGLMLGFFMTTVFGMRIVWEFFKENQVAFENGLPFNMGQLLSIPLVLAGLYLLFLNNKIKELK